MHVRKYVAVSLTRNRRRLAVPRPPHMSHPAPGRVSVTRKRATRIADLYMPCVIWLLSAKSADAKIKKTRAEAQAHSSGGRRTRNQRTHAWGTCDILMLTSGYSDNNRPYLRDGRTVSLERRDYVMPVTIAFIRTILSSIQISERLHLNFGPTMNFNTGIHL